MKEWSCRANAGLSMTVDAVVVSSIIVLKLFSLFFLALSVDTQQANDDQKLDVIFFYNEINNYCEANHNILYYN